MSAVDTKSSTGKPAGLLILGMHRSGTSALARVLDLCGADLGARLLAGSPGNEGGHWEDAFAVELHDRLLAASGAGWDDPLALPGDWCESEMGREAVRQIAAYLRQDRAAHAPWALKDPRLCLFAPAWRQAADAAGMPLSAVLVARHPDEVARSLAARDGIAHGRGLLLWLEYTIAAFAVIDGLPATVIDYPSLLGDWRQALARVSALPGMQALHADAAAAAAVGAFLDPGKRHQRDPGEGGLPEPVARAWEVLRAGAVHGRLDQEAVHALRAELASLRGLFGPVLAESRQLRHQVWLRAGRAEAALADQALGMPAKFEALREGIDANRERLVNAISGELRRMQEVASDAQAATLEAQAVAAAAHAAEAAARREAQAATLEAQAATLEAQAVAAAAHAAETTARREQAATLETQAATLEAQAVAEAAHAAEAAARREAQAATLEAQALAEAAHAAETTARRELLHVRYENGQLQSIAREFERLTASRSWRWTRPLRFAGRLLRGELGESDRARLRGFLAGGADGGGTDPAVDVGLAQPVHPDAPVDVAAPPAPVDAPAPPAPAAPRPDLPDVFVWSVIDWYFRFQRPQHLALALAAKGHRVFYISNNFDDVPVPGFHAEQLDGAGRLFQLRLNLPGNPSIYAGIPTGAQVEALRASLARVLEWAEVDAGIALAQHPFWKPLLRALPDARVVYDCMDHHGGFADNVDAVLEAEAALVADADMLIVTSAWLEDELRAQARHIVLVRNAGEFDFFSHPPERVFEDPSGRRIVGYYGAIAEWFDAALVRQVAEAHADALLVLVGRDTAGVGAQLADLPNVRFVGEVAYGELPYWLHAFDVCLLPFKVIPLTLATNPVKVYEYLSAGKPVVAVDLPEMAQFAGLVHVAATPAAFVSGVAAALAGDATGTAAARRAFAATQTWDHRAAALDAALATLPEPKVSVVVLTWNNMAYTERCLASIEECSGYRGLEVLVVDNASTDGSREWLQAWAAQPSTAGHERRLILNERNLGFSAGNNVGLRAATGEVLVLLNNDTHVTPGWVRGLCNHLRDPSLGLVGPVTNNIGNEAKVDVAYDDMAGMLREAARYTRARPGMRVPLRTAAFFCVAMRRDTFERVGEMDEAFGIGFFEDDDYCRRIEQAGLAVACAEDVFVHHHLSASFDALKAERKRELFEQNKAIYEAKWGPWVPHVYRGGTR